ncbi:MAG: DinB family protein [Candidatus Sumerlaeia bacterium]|nr:DinB family protein [Candidatus Sumerlaeia bacterium]
MGNIAASMLGELEHEAVSTRKYLEAIPDEKLDWQPHAKSMTLRQLAAHVAEIPGWTKETMTLEVMDFASGDYKPTVIAGKADALKVLEEGMAAARSILGKAGDHDFFVTWTMKSGDHVHLSMPRIAVMRGFILNHLVHHRAQLGVYLRLLDVPVPSAYGPTADFPNF